MRAQVHPQERSQTLEEEIQITPPPVSELPSGRIMVSGDQAWFAERARTMRDVLQNALQLPVAMWCGSPTVQATLIILAVFVLATIGSAAVLLAVGEEGDALIAALGSLVVLVTLVWICVVRTQVGYALVIGDVVFSVLVVSFTVLNSVSFTPAHGMFLLFVMFGCGILFAESWILVGYTAAYFVLGLACVLFPSHGTLAARMGMFVLLITGSAVLVGTKIAMSKTTQSLVNRAANAIIFSDGSEESLILAVKGRVVAWSRFAEEVFGPRLRVGTAVLDLFDPSTHNDVERLYHDANVKTGLMSGGSALHSSLAPTIDVSPAQPYHMSLRSSSFLSTVEAVESFLYESLRLNKGRSVIALVRDGFSLPTLAFCKLVMHRGTRASVFTLRFRPSIQLQSSVQSRQPSATDTIVPPPLTPRLSLIDSRRNSEGGSSILRPTSSQLQMVESSTSILKSPSSHEEEPASFAPDPTPDQAKSLWISSISHEFRTPLNAIFGMIQVLQDSASFTPHELEYFNIIKHASHTLLGLVNDLLDFSKIESGKLQIESVEFNLRHLASKCLHYVASTALSKGVELLVNISNYLPEVVMGDPKRIHQVMLNFLSNAIKFTSEGQIVIEIQVIDPSPESVNVSIAVKDSGIGIQASKMNKLFQAFSQLDRSVARNYGGTGLGLAICRQLVQLMGGSIGADSKERKGSNFWFTLPLRLPNPNMFPLRKVFSFDKSLGQPNILLCHSNKTAATSLTDALRSWGCLVSSFDNLRSAINAVISDPSRFSVFIVDGVALNLHRIATRYNSVASPPPLLVITDRTRFTAHQLGAITPIPPLFKPVDDEKLFCTLASLLELIPAGTYVPNSSPNGDDNTHDAVVGAQPTIGLGDLLQSGSEAWFESVLGGSGSRELPSLSAVPEMSCPPSASSTSSQTLPLSSTTLNIAIVDDSPMNNLVLEKFLIKIGVDATSISKFTSGQAFLDFATNPTTRPINMLFCDMQMPNGLSGPETMSKFRDYEATIQQSLPSAAPAFIVALTGMDPDEIRDDLQPYSVLDIILKPISLERLSTVYNRCTQLFQSMSTSKLFSGNLSPGQSCSSTSAVEADANANAGASSSGQPSSASAASSSPSSSPSPSPSPSSSSSSSSSSSTSNLGDDDNAQSRPPAPAPATMALTLPLPPTTKPASDDKPVSDKKTRRRSSGSKSERKTSGPAGLSLRVVEAPASPRPVAVLCSHNSSTEITLSRESSNLRSLNRILVVDDNGLNRLVLSKMMRMAKFDVDLAKDGQEAVDKWQAHGYAAILMDCVMPVLDGYEATQKIRAREAVRTGNRRVPIIAVTANALAGDRENCLAAGMDEYVAKPIIKKELMEKLAMFGVVPLSDSSCSRSPTTPKIPSNPQSPSSSAAPPRHALRKTSSDNLVVPELDSRSRAVTASNNTSQAVSKGASVQWPPRDAYWLVPSVPKRRRSVSIDIRPRNSRLCSSSSDDLAHEDSPRLAAQRSLSRSALSPTSETVIKSRAVVQNPNIDVYEEVQGRSRLKHHTMMMLQQ